ncbi:MAG: hypothetical protein A3C53_07415 [Omnitrophica WOR_2 bacterium RIFCSPHIGHO2_02_FULL_68_15]|nr:MAG: hypothetical protein A3C53_07415 [Omnitrophica WOR_2 bacterium RIFCSPHIGHO2_02_FULL_68_15]
MWRTLLFAGGVGSIVSVAVWELLMWAGRRSTARELQRRVRRVTSEPGAAAQAVEPLRNVRYSDLLRLDRFIRRFSLFASLARFLQQAGVRMDVTAFLLLHLACLGVGLFFALGLRVPPLLAAPLVAGLTVLPTAAAVVKRRKRLHHLTEQLPDAIRLISSSMRAGLGLDVGLNAVVTEMPDPIRGEFAQLVNEALLEFNMNDAFRRFAKRIPVSDYKLFASAACLHREVGGNFAELLDELEETLRERVRLQRELKTTTALSRFEGLFLGILPLVVSAVLFALNPGYYRPFWQDEAGRMMLTVAVALQLVGFVVIRWMIRLRTS